MSADSTNEFQLAFFRCARQLAKDPSAALEKMFDLFARRLVRLAMTITGIQPDAEDALQTAFSRIAARPRLLAQADLPWAYLIRTVRNEAVRIVQKKRHIHLEYTDRSGGEQSPEEIFQMEETANRVRQILRTLPAAQYEVVILKHWEDLTFAEFAEVLGKSQNTVSSRYRYAMEKLHGDWNR